MNVRINENNWSHTTLLWMVVLIWFCSNLLSQAVFMGMNGHPYGSELILNEIGSWHWLLLGFELIIYASLSYYFFKKTSKFLKRV